MAMAGNVRVNGGLLVNEPSRCELRGPTPRRTTVINGGTQSSVPEKGHKITLTYGDQTFADDEARAELAAALGAIPGTAEITVTLHDGTDQTVIVNVDEELPSLIGIGGLALQWTVELLEAP